MDSDLDVGYLPFLPKSGVHGSNGGSEGFDRSASIPDMRSMTKCRDFEEEKGSLSGLLRKTTGEIDFVAC